MSEPKPPASPAAPGVVGAVIDLGRSVAGGMPSGLLVICIVFGGLIWFLDSQNEQRTRSMEQRTQVVGRLLEQCMSSVLKPLAVPLPP